MIDFENTYDEILWIKLYEIQYDIRKVRPKFSEFNWKMIVFMKINEIRSIEREF